MEPKMSQEFDEWLDNCPVQWFRDEHTEESATYTFINDQH